MELTLQSPARPAGSVIEALQAEGVSYDDIRMGLDLQEAQRKAGVPVLPLRVICGLDAPDAQALVTYTNELGTESTLALTVGLPDGSGGRYVTVNDDPTIYRMEETSLVQLLTLAETGLN